MNTEEKLRQLRAENPFTSSSVGDPWEDRYFDVRSVNERAFNEISQLIDQKIKDPALSCAGLVFGEVGSGKTHLVSRILNYDKEKEFSFSFAYIQPIEDPEQTYRYLLREVIVNLCYPIHKNSAVTQMDMILDKSFKEIAEPYPASFAAQAERCLKAFRNDPLRLFREKKIHTGMFKELGSSFKSFIAARKRRSPDEADKKALEFMRTLFPDIPKEFLKVLFQYQIPEKRAAAVDWLKGIAIDGEDALRLGVADRIADSSALLEQKSRNILSCMGTLLTRYNQPLVICFDRLENYDTDEKIHSLGKMVEFLVDKAKAMLPLVFVRGQQWEESFTAKLNQQVITRLKTNEFQLKGCNAEQSLEIIARRLGSLYGEVRGQRSGVRGQHSEPRTPDLSAPNLFPFDRDKLAEIFKTRLHTPRQVIMLANQRLKQILYPDQNSQNSQNVQNSDLSLERLQDEFESQFRIISADLDRYPPDRSRLRRALELYLKAMPDQSLVSSLNRPEDKYLDFECILSGDDSAKSAVFIIDTELNNSYVRASLKRGVAFLEASPRNKAVYIRDARCPIPPPPQWKATNDMLAEFKNIGGIFIQLDAEQSARWYALALLGFAIKSGDVTLIDADSHSRSVSVYELAAYIRERIRRKDSGFDMIEAVLNS